MIGIVILNVILKFIYIDFPEIGGDEPFTLFYANSDINFFFNILENENNPPLFTLLLKGWISLFGDSVHSVRALPLIFSSVTAGIIYLFGHRFYNRQTGLFAALLFTFANYHIFFAHEARPYAFFALLTIASMYSFLRLTLHSSKKHIFYLALFNTLLIYNHFFGFFLLFVQFLSFVSIKELRANSLKRIVISLGITALSYIAYLPIFFKRFSESSGGTWVESPNLNELYSNIRKFSNEPVIAVLFLALLIAAPVAYFLRKKISVTSQTKVIIIWFLVPYILMFALSQKLPMFLDRYLVYISLAFYLSVIIAVTTIFKNLKVQIAVLSLATLGMIFTSDLKSGNPRKNVAAIEKVAEKKTERTAVILCPSWHKLLFTYHYDQSIFKDYTNIDTRLESHGFFPVDNIDGITNEMLGKYDHIIYFDGWSELVDPAGDTHKKIKTKFDLTETDDSHEGTILYYYKRKQ
jgi:uncharacterized membrane protein